MAARRKKIGRICGDDRMVECVQMKLSVFGHGTMKKGYTSLNGIAPWSVHSLALLIMFTMR